MTILKIGFLAMALPLFAGCSTPVKTVPFKIQSDPLGAYVLYQVQADQGDSDRSYDWVYLGNTPLNTRRAVMSKDLKNADAFMIRVMKEGYLDQQKAWTGNQLVKDAQSKGAVYWNPRLVPAN